jgi:hypothetical protein
MAFTTTPILVADLSGETRKFIGAVSQSGVDETGEGIMFANAKVKGLHVPDAGDGDLTIWNANASAAVAVLKTGGDHSIGIASKTVTFAGDVNIAGNIIIGGSAQQIDAEKVLIADNYVDLNAGYSADAAVGGGFTVIYNPEATGTTTTGAGVFVAGVAATSNPTVTVASGGVTAAGIAAGDIFSISGAADPGNNGLYECLGVAADTITVAGIGTTGTQQDFLANQFTSTTDTGCTLVVVRVGVMRLTSAGAWEVSDGGTTDSSATNMAFNELVDVSGATFTGSVVISTGGDLTLNSGATVTAILDEDTMGTASATALATQQSIKAYVDTQVSAVATTLSGLTDTTIATVGGGDFLVYDGTDSWDNRAMSGDATLAATGAVTLAAANTNLTTLANVVEVGALAAGSIAAGFGSIALNDNTEILFGTGSDLKMEFNGTNFHVQWGVADTGAVHFGTNDTNGGDVVWFSADAGSNLTLDYGANSATFDDVDVILANGSLFTFGGIGFTGAIDDDTMGTASATTIATSESIKAYVDGKSHVSSFSGLTDTTIAALSGGHVAIYDGTDSWDNKAISGDATLASTGALTLDAANTSQTTITNLVTVGALASGSIAPGFGTIDTNSAITASGGITSDAGEVLISGGNMQLGDDIVLSLGAVDDVTMSWNNASTFFDLDVGGSVQIDATGAIAIESSAGAISIGADAIAQAINIGTLGARTITVGNVAGVVVLDGDVNLNHARTEGISGLTEANSINAGDIAYLSGDITISPALADSADSCLKAIGCYDGTRVVGNGGACTVTKETGFALTAGEKVYLFDSASSVVNFANRPSASGTYRMRVGRVLTGVASSASSVRIIVDMDDPIENP